MFEDESAPPESLAGFKDAEVGKRYLCKVSEEQFRAIRQNKQGIYRDLVEISHLAREHELPEQVKEVQKTAR